MSGPISNAHITHIFIELLFSFPKSSVIQKQIGLRRKRKYTYTKLECALSKFEVSILTAFLCKETDESQISLFAKSQSNPMILRARVSEWHSIAKQKPRNHPIFGWWEGELVYTTFIGNQISGSLFINSAQFCPSASHNLSHLSLLKTLLTSDLQAQVPHARQMLLWTVGFPWQHVYLHDACWCASEFKFSSSTKPVLIAPTLDRAVGA